MSPEPLLRRTLASAKPILRYGEAGDLAEARRAKAGFRGTSGLPEGLHSKDSTKVKSGLKEMI